MKTAAILLASGAALAMSAPVTTHGTVPATAQLDSPAARGAPPDALFQADTILELRLEGPLREIATDRVGEPVEHPARLDWRAPDGSAVTLEVEIRARGRSRRREEVCAFPPIRLDLPKSRVAGTVFAHQNKLKIVTHCKRLGNRGVEQRDWIALEYLAYRLLNTVTDYSFRVRPLTITWADTASPGREYTHPAFFIEHKDRLAERLGLDVSELHRIDPASLAPSITQVMELFQYLIGNTDFSFVLGPGEESCCHNAIQLTDGRRFAPIPYDFDLTGLVDKPGAMPAPSANIMRVTQRRYRGLCRDGSVLEEAVGRFRDARPAMEAELARVSGLFGISPGAERHARRFLRGYFDSVSTPKRLRRNVTRYCRDGSRSASRPSVPPCADGPDSPARCADSAVRSAARD